MVLEVVQVGPGEARLGREKPLPRVNPKGAILFSWKKRRLSASVSSGVCEDDVCSVGRRRVGGRRETM